MKVLFLTLLSIITIKAYSQNDFRGLRWGMSIEQVKSIETAPLTNSEKSFSGISGGQTYYNGFDLIYEGITLAERKGDLYYHFENGKLLKIRVVFRHDLYTNYVSSLTNTVREFKTLFDGFYRRGFRYTSPLLCGDSAYQGPDYKNQDNRKILEMKDWNINPEILELNEKMINERHYTASFFRIENERTRGLMEFTTKYSELNHISPIILEFKPSYKLEDEIKRADF